MNDMVVKQAVEEIEKLMVGRECVAFRWRDSAVSGIEGRWFEAEVRDEVEKAGFTLDFHSESRDDDEEVVAVWRTCSTDMFKVGARLYWAMAYDSKPVVCRCCGQRKWMAYSPDVRAYDVVGRDVCPVRKKEGFVMKSEEEERGSFIAVIEGDNSSFRDGFYASEERAMKAAKDLAEMRMKLSRERFEAMDERSAEGAIVE